MHPDMCETEREPEVDKHDLMCSYDDCRGRIHHLLDDAYELRRAAGEVLSTSGFKDKLTHDDLSDLRRAVRRYDSSPAT